MPFCPSAIDETLVVHNNFPLLHTDAATSPFDLPLLTLLFAQWPIALPNGCPLCLLCTVCHLGETLRISFAHSPLWVSKTKTLASALASAAANSRFYRFVGDSLATVLVTDLPHLCLTALHFGLPLPLLVALSGERDTFKQHLPRFTPTL